MVATSIPSNPTILPPHNRTNSTAAAVLDYLRTHKNLKENGRGRYQANSPFRADSDSMSFSLKIEGDEHGAYKDFVSNESGSLYDLAKHLGIETAQRQPVASTKRPYRGLADYAEAHGLTADALNAWRWIEVMYQDRLALQYETRTGRRWRFLDGNKPYYKSESGYKRCWYGLSRDIAARVSNGQPLVVCNGEISTIKAQAMGIAAVAVTGGENAIPPELLDDLSWAIDPAISQVIVAMDCDSKGKSAAAQVAAQFRAAGYNVRAVDLGLGHNGDLADFCSLYGDSSSEKLNALPAMADALIATAPRPWVIIPARDLKNLPKMTWLVDGEIPDHGLTVIFGPSGVGKSFLALDYALKIAQNKTVVYVAAEGESGYLLRVSAWCQHNEKNEANLYMCLGSPNLMDDADLEQFIHAICNLTPVMVVVDTLAMAMIGADENSSRDMGRIIMACRSLQREAHCAVVLVHHTNKGGTTERGSGALRGAADSMIRVTGDDNIILVESVKSKDTEQFQTRYMQLLPITTVEGVSRVLVSASIVEQTTDDKITRNQRKVLEAMALDVFQVNGATVADLAETTDLGRGQIYRVLSKLSELKFIDQPQDRGPYGITEAGIAKLNDSLSQNDSVNDSPQKAVFKGNDSMTQMTHSDSHSKRGFKAKHDETSESLSHSGRKRSKHSESLGAKSESLDETSESMTQSELFQRYPNLAYHPGAGAPDYSGETS